MVKAGPVVLPGAATAAQAFGRIVQASIRQFRLNEALLQAGRNPAALHQARVALRRLRSAFATFKPIVAGATQAHLAAELRWLAGELGDARNLDVLLDRVGPGGLHDRLAAARDAAYARVEQVLGSPRVRTLMLDLAAWTFAGDWTRVPALAPDRDEPVREAAGRALDRFHRKVMKGGRHLESVDDEARHQLRKDAKKLRYASDFFASVFGRKRERRRYRKFVAALEALQDQLGALNDLATAPQLLATLGIAPDATPLAKGGHGAKLLKQAARAHAELHERKRYWR
ncbi:CHAD domain-containing protein [Sphingomonas qomolangmaensis]|uniref:CHAD domain-containing protein n=1 Tax=Sphingomonas qomolangmaensis TaxID=2918765 RepID=A0ABY5LEE5_9SPHN|nr:CHAD domain-containing protein [Sphingomonas qomolangmaensis]UUL84154.1 CHAD domain-containing protein [Sphingomonas qomolangmaensis]